MVAFSARLAFCVYGMPHVSITRVKRDCRPPSMGLKGNSSPLPRLRTSKLTAPVNRPLFCTESFRQVKNDRLLNPSRKRTEQRYLWRARLELAGQSDDFILRQRTMRLEGLLKKTVKIGQFSLREQLLEVRRTSKSGRPKRTATLVSENCFRLVIS